MQRYRDRTYAIGPVTITRHWIDWTEHGPGLADLARLTLRRLEAIPPASDDHYYLTPGWTLTAPGTVDEAVFLKQARRACILWTKQLRRVVGSGEVSRFSRRHSGPEDRMLVTSGTLLLRGRQAHIKRLAEAGPKTKTA